MIKVPAMVRITLAKAYELLEKWWAQKDLNLRPADYESDSLLFVSVD
jgi:muramidase (phage lysozyme)